MKDFPCEIIEDLLPIYVEHVETADTHELVEEHLAECASCRAKAAQMQVPIRVPMDVDTGLLRKTRQGIWRRTYAVLGLAAVVVAAALLWIVASNMHSTTVTAEVQTEWTEESREVEV